MILKGDPGCGKTLLKLALAVYHRMRGILFLATSPTNEACDAFVVAIKEWNTAITGTLKLNDNYIRVYYIHIYSRCYWILKAPLEIF